MAYFRGHKIIKRLFLENISSNFAKEAVLGPSKISNYPFDKNEPFKKMLFVLHFRVRSTEDLQYNTTQIFSIFIIKNFFLKPTLNILFPSWTF